MSKPRRFVRMFKPQFAGKVQSGEKLQTVRPRPKRMPRAGDIIDCRAWAGKAYRSKQRKLREGTITRVEEIGINAGGIRLGPGPVRDENGNTVWGVESQFPDTNLFAILDGFTGWEEMRDWFHVEHGLPFEGIVIYWKPLEGGGDG